MTGPFSIQSGQLVDKGEISFLVQSTLDGYQYKAPPSGNTIGAPWSAEKVHAYVEKLKAALVEPYLQRFELRESCEQVGLAEPSYAEYWVVVEAGGGYLEWYDPVTGEFGLALRGEGSGTPVSIGVRGDLVGVFCAM